jgi:prepilin-type N-terminal cleavage/methylation domain-containing protein/prepilin-type processing-associated H-X9-DG protein
MTTKGKQTGFTLIELLVVIAIILILAAILFPVFTRVRENARRTSCQSNLKQIGIGIMMYTQDYDEYFPIQPSGGNLDAYSYYTYIKNVQVINCPSKTFSDGSPTTGGYSSNPLIMRVPSTTNNIGIGPNTRFVNHGTLVAPAKTYLVLDGGFYTIHPDYATSPNGNNFYLPGAGSYGVVQNSGMRAENVPDFLNGRHFTGVNILFTDGHVKWLKSSVPLNEARKTVGEPSTCERSRARANCTGIWPYGNWDPGNT